MANITPRKNKAGEINSYTIRVYHGYDGAGKRLKPYSVSYKPAQGMTQKQIEKELNKTAVQFEEQCKNGLIGSATKITLAEYCKQYLEIKKKVLSPATYAFYQAALERVILPALGHHKINQIRPVHIQAFINMLIAKPIDHPSMNTSEFISASTVKRYFAILQSVLKLAVKQKLITENPARAELLDLPKIVAPKVDIFTKQEAAEMLSFLATENLQFQTLIQLAIMTGARRGELTALKFSDFDYEAHKMIISRAAVKLKGKPAQLKPPKDYQVRTVTVSQYCIDLVKLLEEEKEREAQRLGSAWLGDEWLFTQWNGEMMNPQTPTKQFSNFLSKNKLKHRKFHSLRHTSATLLLYGGINIKQVQERLGHGDIKTTNQYLHCLAEADEEAANVLQNMLITKTVTQKEKHA